jgi:hypothetical protein
MRFSGDLAANAPSLARCGRHRRLPGGRPAPAGTRRERSPHHRPGRSGRVGGAEHGPGRLTLANRNPVQKRGHAPSRMPRLGRLWAPARTPRHNVTIGRSERRPVVTQRALISHQRHIARQLAGSHCYEVAHGSIRPPSVSGQQPRRVLKLDTPAGRGDTLRDGRPHKGEGPATGRSGGRFGLTLLGLRVQFDRKRRLAVQLSRTDAPALLEGPRAMHECKGNRLECVWRVGTVRQRTRTS